MGPPTEHSQREPNAIDVRARNGRGRASLSGGRNDTGGVIRDPSAVAEPRRFHWKRPLDLLVVGVSLPLVLPITGLIAVLIRLDTPGPIFYRQERVGQGGRTFRIWKFRSMYHGSTDREHKEAVDAWFAGTPSQGGYKSPRDPRVTRVGRWLRRTSLDELPQLFNVLAGEMSLVGPRPAIPYELEYYLPDHFQRFQVKPGMTGLWQVSGRDACSAEQMMWFDSVYLRKVSLALDLRILVFTVPALFGRTPWQRSQRVRGASERTDG